MFWLYLPRLSKVWKLQLNGLLVEFNERVNVKSLNAGVPSSSSALSLAPDRMTWILDVSRSPSRLGLFYIVISRVAGFSPLQLASSQHNLSPFLLINMSLHYVGAMCACISHAWSMFITCLNRSSDITSLQIKRSDSLLWSWHLNIPIYFLSCRLLI